MRPRCMAIALCVHRDQVHGVGLGELGDPAHLFDQAVVVEDRQVALHTFGSQLAVHELDRLLGAGGQLRVDGVVRARIASDQGGGQQGETEGPQCVTHRVSPFRFVHSFGHTGSARRKRKIAIVVLVPRPDRLAQPPSASSPRRARSSDGSSATARAVFRELAQGDRIDTVGGHGGCLLSILEEDLQ